MNPYLLISRLLQYPAGDDVSELVDVCPTLANETQRRSIENFLAYVEATSLSEQQANYVATFDFNKRTSLYLSFHGLGDRRERGMAMLNLKQRYRAAGFDLVDGELPDYLPVLLEFCAFAPAEFVDELLDEFRPPLELVRAALADESSPYAFLLDAVLCDCGELDEHQRATIVQRAAEGPPTEMVGLEPFTLAESYVEGREPSPAKVAQ